MLQQSGRFLGLRNHETGNQYLPANSELWPNSGVFFLLIRTCCHFKCWVKPTPHKFPWVGLFREHRILHVKLIVPEISQLQNSRLILAHPVDESLVFLTETHFSTWLKLLQPSFLQRIDTRETWMLSTPVAAATSLRWGSNRRKPIFSWAQWDHRSVPFKFF